jgi:phosphoglycerol geranylgeranyltransferase
VPPEMVHMVKKFIDVPLIVGGGIKTKTQALAVVSAGADVIVTGNVIEGAAAKQKVSEIIGGIKGTKP